jgi:hypothetical protein
LLKKYSQSRFHNEEVENELFCDIKDGKIWLQHNATDTDVGQELMEMGVAQKDIVLGLHPPYKGASKG